MRVLNATLKNERDDILYLRGFFFSSDIRVSFAYENLVKSDRHDMRTNIIVHPYSINKHNDTTF